MFAFDSTLARALELMANARLASIPPMAPPCGIFHPGKAESWVSPFARSTFSSRVSNGFWREIVAMPSFSVAVALFY